MISFIDESTKAQRYHIICLRSHGTCGSWDLSLGSWFLTHHLGGYKSSLRLHSLSGSCPGLEWRSSRHRQPQQVVVLPIPKTLPLLFLICLFSSVICLFSNFSKFLCLVFLCPHSCLSSALAQGSWPSDLGWVACV